MSNNDGSAGESIDLDSIYELAIQLGKEAGEILAQRAQDRFSQNTPTSHVEKASAVDLVTQTDEDVEAHIRERVRAKFPTHDFIGEESYEKGSSKEYLITKKPTWCVDPLDGTVNYLHLFPMFCVSISFLLDGEPVIGVINAPLLNQMFTACKGKGAWLNETQQLPLSRYPMPVDAPKGCILTCEWGKDRRDIPDGNLSRKIDSFLNLAAETGGRGGKGGMVHGVRSLGSATMGLAYCAMGVTDIWWEGGCWEWDVAAGICMVREAGGLVTTANPPEDENAAIENAWLGGRLYLAVRPAGDSENETGRQGQERTVREVWRRVRSLDYSRPRAPGSV